MSYEVLARKWRPRTFEEMVGQEHVLRALINALDNDRLHHAFLFTGTRGVGKTTIARILAKSLNCERGVSSTPCGECSACREIDEGRFIDLIEVDAASRTKVEDTRELLENVQYAPTRGRYKVYLVDEVHMLSNHSFNALLKTLEEPPPHVKFLLATTDPQKLPVTVLSRCLQFSLKRLSPERIAAHLEKVLGAEGVSFEKGAVRLLARAADGSMRDALSLLDQAIAHGGGELRESAVGEMLGTIDPGRVRALLRHLAADDGEALLQEAAFLSEQGADFLGVLGELLSLLHRVAVLQTVGEAAADPEEGAALVELARLLSPEDTQLFYQIALIGRRDLPLAPDPRSGFEMILLRMLAFRPAGSGDGEIAEGRRRSGEVAARSAPSGGQRGIAEPAPPAAPAGEAPAEAARGEAEKPRPPGGEGAGEWSEVVAALGLRGIARELAANSLLRGREGDRIRLVLEERYAQICTDRAKKSLEAALSRHYGETVRLEIEVGSVEGETPARRRARQAEERHREAVAAIEQDPTVGSLREVLGAEVRPDRVRPLDE